jgi:hypothetical protein
MPHAAEERPPHGKICDSFDFSAAPTVSKARFLALTQSGDA